MIGDRFVRYPKPVAPRALPRLNQFIGFLSRKTDDAILRASHITPNGYGSRLLIDIIKLANLEKILSPDWSTTKLIDYLVWIHRELEKPIDVRIGKHTTRSLFINSKTPCFELITASRRETLLADIPFHLDYGNPAWRNIQPLRISDMGTTDLRFQVYNDQLMYQRQGPTHAIYSLDCVALVAKFVSYYKSIAKIHSLDQVLLDFVHKEVIVPSLLQDSMAIWLRNIYKQQFLMTSPMESHTSTMWDVVNIDTIGSDFSGAMVDILHLKTDLKNQSITNHTAMASLILGIEGQSFTTYYKELYYTTVTPDEQPYVWVDCLKNLSWWEFMLTLSSFIPNNPDVVSLRRDIIRDVRFWLMIKPWNDIHGSVPYKTMVRSRLEGLYTYLQQS